MCGPHHERIGIVACVDTSEDNMAKFGTEFVTFAFALSTLGMLIIEYCVRRTENRMKEKEGDAAALHFLKKKQRRFEMLRLVLLCVVSVMVIVGYTTKFVAWFAADASGETYYECHP